MPDICNKLRITITIITTSRQNSQNFTANLMIFYKDPVKQNLEMILWKRPNSEYFQLVDDRLITVEHRQAYGIGKSAVF